MFFFFKTFLDSGFCSEMLIAKLATMLVFYNDDIRYTLTITQLYTLPPDTGDRGPHCREHKEQGRARQLTV